MTAQSTAPKPFCFVLMPFDDAFKDVYQIGIKEACTAAGAYCERVDEQIFHERILDRIYNQIAKADLIIADMTGRNPNVFYEVGYAHALGKPTVLITKQADDIPFDLKHFPHIVYGDSLVTLRDELTKRVQWHMANPVGGAAERGIQIELYCGNKDLSRDSVVCVFPYNGYPTGDITIYNASATTFETGAFKMGVFTAAEYTLIDMDTGNQLGRPINLPTGQVIYMLPDFPTLFPEGYASFRFEIVLFNHRPVEGAEFPVAFRAYTPSGVRDYALAFQRGKKDEVKTEGIDLGTAGIA